MNYSVYFVDLVNKYELQLKINVTSLKINLFFQSWQTARHEGWSRRLESHNCRHLRTVGSSEIFSWSTTRSLGQRRFSRQWMVWQFGQFCSMGRRSEELRQLGRIVSLVIAEEFDSSGRFSDEGLSGE